MVHALKHIALRIWGTVLLGGLACLWLLPVLGSNLDLAWILMPAAILAIAIFMFLGWLLNRLALFLADRQLHEAAAWERLGSNKDAATAYEKALAIFDSFLISPRIKRLESGRLMSRLTRFYLAKTDKQHYSEAFIVFYLNSHPGDHEVAENWLRQSRAGEGLETQFHDTAARIGEALQNNKTIQQLLAQLYLSENRTDFPALQTYRLATRGRGQAARATANDLAMLFLKDGRADEWALQLYLQAASDDRHQKELLNGIAACVHWIPETERNKRLMKFSRRLLEGIGRERLAMMRVGFTPPKPSEPTVKRSGTLEAMAPAGRAIRKTFAGAGEVFTGFLHSGRSLTTNVFHRIRRSSLTRPFLKWTAVTLLSAGVILLIVNTASHLVQSQAPQDDPATPVERVVSDPFTLQVAAYLKKKHAEKYVADLKNLGLDAYWIATTRQNKRWYQVRVSHFPDKAATRAYGVALRKKGIIDDFYVANYDPG
jgi:hypothetical protein